MQGTEIPDQKMFLVWSTASFEAFNFGVFMERMTTSHANSEARVTSQYWGYRELLADEVETVYGGGDGAGGEPRSYDAASSPTPSTPSTINPTFAGQPSTPDTTNSGVPRDLCVAAVNGLVGGLSGKAGGFKGGFLGGFIGTGLAETICPRADSGSGNGGDYGPGTTTAGDASVSDMA